MDTEQIKALLARYQQDACTPAEKVVVEQWFDSINCHRSNVIDEVALHAHLDEVKMQLQHILPQRRFSPRSLWRAAAVGIAAGLMLFVGITNHKLVNTNKTPATHALAALPPAHSNRVVENGYVVVTTGKGSTEQVALGDGSTVIVNASSRLRYPVQFPADKRQVFLEEGEAYFKVANDASRAFSVVAGALRTTALGTSFNIRAYKQENRITVSLLTGKVKVDDATCDKKAPIVLLPSERLNYDCLSSNLSKNSFTRQEEIIGWKQGFLLFKDASYKEVITEIENRYGVTIVNESKQQEWDYTGFFQDESLQEVIETICISKNINYSINKDTVYFRN